MSKALDIYLELCGSARGVRASLTRARRAYFGHGCSLVDCGCISRYGGSLEGPSFTGVLSKSGVYHVLIFKNDLSESTMGMSEYEPAINLTCTLAHPYLP
jgi:hypothetical protein